MPSRGAKERAKPCLPSPGPLERSFAALLPLRDARKPDGRRPIPPTNQPTKTDFYGGLPFNFQERNKERKAGKERENRRRPFQPDDV